MQQISFIGGARLSPQCESLVEGVGAMIRECGYSLVSGGMGGAMAAVCRGFQSVKGEGVAIGILPGCDPGDANEWVDVVLPTGLDVGRNALVVSAGAGIVAYGGGAGTLSELALASQLGRPILLLHGGGGWVDRLREDKFLDERRSTPLGHANSLPELRSWLQGLDMQGGGYGPVNSGHLQR